MTAINGWAFFSRTRGYKLLAMRTSMALSFTMLLLCSACSDDTAETEPTNSTGTEVRATIGPEGGELVGKVGTELEGVKLSIPADALNSEVDVWIRPTFDGDSLPALSERVGLQVEVGSDGELDAAATLTLPFDAGQVGRFGETADDVKVWVKGEGNAWSLVEADANSDVDVTISLEAFTTAAAGVKVLTFPPVCDASCDALAEAHFDVNECSATSACIAQIVSPRFVETFDFAVSASGALGFLSPAGIMVIAVSHELVGGATIESPELPPGTSIRTGSSFVQETFFAGLGSAGNVAFNGTSKPNAFDVGAGLGVVETKNGATLRLSRNSSTGNLVVVDHATGKTLKIPPLSIPSNANIASIFVQSPRDPDSMMVIAVSHVIELKLSSGGDQLSETARIELPSSLQVAGSKQLRGSDEIMVIAVLVGGKVAVSVDAEPFEILDLDFAASSVAVDALGRVLIGSAKSPELVRQAQSGLPTGIRLSDAATTASEFSARIPRAIQASDDGFVVLTQDRNFLSVELP